MATFELTCGALPQSSVCIGFDGREELSRPLWFDVYLTIPASDDLDLKEVVGANASLKIQLGTPTVLEIAAPPFELHGMIAELELIRTSDGNALYRAALVSRVWQLLLSSHSRIWTKRSIKEIVAEVLSEHGLLEGDDVEFRLSAEPAAEEHVSQYRETNLAFITRWMEREGWYYFFEHEDGKDKLVVADAPSAHKSRRQQPVRYSPSGEQDRSLSNLLLDFAADKRLVPSRLEVRDYDYMKPTLAVKGSGEAGQQGIGQLVDYGARLFTPDDAARIATIRAEELKARESTFTGRGAATLMLSGHLFDLAHHPRPEMNRSYLLTSVRHLGYQPSLGPAWGELIPIPPQPDVYRIEIRAIESELQFRAARVTQWPRIDGFENGVVDGPASSPYGQIDDQGRYNVKLKYDEGTLRDGKASTWVRMAQPHGGTVEGFHFPLRKGTEVIIQFLGGDPDRPVITYVAPNAVTPSKVVASNHSQNVVQTGSENWIVAEDKQSAEWFHLYSPAGGLNASLYLGVPRKEGGYALTCPDAPAVAEKGANATENGPYAFQLRTDGNLEVYAGGNINVNAGASVQMRSQGGDFRTWSSGDWYLDVCGPAIENYENTLHYRVKKKADRKYAADYNLTVDKPVTRTYDQTLTTFVKQNATYLFKSDHKEKIAAKHKEDIDNGLYELVVGDQKTTTTTTHKITVKSGGQELKVGGDQLRTITGGAKTETTAAVTWDVGGTFSLNVTGAYNLSAQKEVEIIHGVKFEATALKLDLSFGMFHDKWWGARLAINATDMLDVAILRASATIIDIGLTGLSMVRAGAELTAQLIKVEAKPMHNQADIVEFNTAFTIEI